MSSGSMHCQGHRRRLKEKFSRDSTQLEDYEILELLLTYVLPRKDTKPLAKELLANFGSLKGVLVANPREIRNIQGIGQGVELFLRLWQEFWARLNKQSLGQKALMDSPGKVADLLASIIRYDPKESFWVVLVDNKNRLLSYNSLGSGTVDKNVLYPREVFSLALEYQASGIILVHNHPGGDPKPSSQDVQLTNKIKDTAGELDLRLLDHIIVAEESYCSLQAEGLIS